MGGHATAYDPAVPEAQHVDILDAADAYLRARSPDRATFTVQDRHFMSNETPLEAYAIVELDGESWALLLIADIGIALVALRDVRVEARLLGPLRGVYREEWVFEEDEIGPALTMMFDDARLPSGTLSVRTDPPPRPGAFRDFRVERAREMNARIRVCLREWAVSPLP
jgi:hypothetical protein